MENCLFRSGNPATEEYNVGLKYDLQNLSGGKWHKKMLPSRRMQEPPFWRTAEVLSVIAAELWLFSYFPLPPALVFLSTSCLHSPPLSPAVFPTLAEVHTRQWHLPPRPNTRQACPADRHHFGVGRWDLPEKSAKSCGPYLAHKTDGFATWALGKQGPT